MFIDHGSRAEAAGGCVCLDGKSIQTVVEQNLHLGLLLRGG